MDNFQANELMRTLGNIDKTLGGIRDAIRSLAPQPIGVETGRASKGDPVDIAVEFEKIIAAQTDPLADLLAKLEDRPSFRNALKAIADSAMSASTKIVEEMTTPTDPPAMPFAEWWNLLTEGFKTPPAAQRRNETGIDPETRDD